MKPFHLSSETVLPIKPFYLSKLQLVPLLPGGAELAVAGRFGGELDVRPSHQRHAHLANVTNGADDDENDGGGGDGGGDGGADVAAGAKGKTMALEAAKSELARLQAVNKAATESKARAPLRTGGAPSPVGAGAQQSGGGGGIDPARVERLRAGLREREDAMPGMEPFYPSSETVLPIT